MRTLLLHEYRRVLLRDPNLPEQLLPADWPGRTARDLCRDMYAALLDASEDYLREVVEVADGTLANASRLLRKRFAAAQATGSGPQATY